MDEEQGKLLHNLLRFGRLLHELGLPVNPGRLIDVMEALRFVEVGRKPDFYYTLRTLLVQRKEQLPLFDQAFDLFWRKPDDGTGGFEFNDLFAPQDQAQERVQPPELQRKEEAAEVADDGDAETVIELTKTYSSSEMLRQKDFEQMSADEVQSVKRLMAQLVWQLGQRRTRRLEPGRGSNLDMRRTIRRNYRYGSEMLSLMTRKQKIKPRPLVVLADISGSMERYAKLLIHFLYSLAEGLDQRVEVFVFGTRLTRITRQLRQGNADRAIQEAAAVVPDWGGGTRIGIAIKQFNYQWARRVLRGGAITILISDGWDRGDPELLAREMERLQKLTHRLIWLNPLLGSPRYEPLTRGMVAALPHIDDFLPVHNLVSLEDLAKHLALLDQKRARRRNMHGAAFIGRRP